MDVLPSTSRTVAPRAWVRAIGQPRTAPDVRRDLSLAAERPARLRGKNPASPFWPLGSATLSAEHVVAREGRRGAWAGRGRGQPGAAARRRDHPAWRGGALRRR